MVVEEKTVIHELLVDREKNHSAITTAWPDETICKGFEQKRSLL